MRTWVVIIVSGICSCLSFSLSLLALRSDGSGAVLFAGFGLFSGAFSIASTMRILAEKGIYRRKIDDKISGPPKPASFVPHWFIMLALTVTVIAVLCAVLIPVLRK